MKIRRPRSSATAVACLLATALAMAEATHAELESPSERRCLGEAEGCDGDGSPLPRTSAREGHLGDPADGKYGLGLAQVFDNDTGKTTASIYSSPESD